MLVHALKMGIVGVGTAPFIPNFGTRRGEW